MANIAKKFLIMLKNLQEMHLKLLQKKVIQKTAEATGDLIGNKIADKIRKVLKCSQQNNSEQLQISMIKKCVRKDLYLQKKDIKLLMI